jgi:hypothetical protein
MSALAKAFEPILKVAARAYQGALATELNKMGELDNYSFFFRPIDGQLRHVSIVCLAHWLDGKTLLP